MSSYSYEFQKEFDNIYGFILDKYKINIKSKEQLIKYVKTNLAFLQSLKIWEKYLCEEFNKVLGIDNYFKEMISNTIHVIILGTIDLKMPSLIMMRRTQEIILTYLYYSEHPVEYHKKEKDDSIRNFSGFQELKEYIKKYPYFIKYNVEQKRIEELVVKIIDDWTKLYRDLSNYVHGTNSNYFEMVSYVDEFKFDKKDINYLTTQVRKISSIVNMLLIVFYFNIYVKMNENTEKTLIRNCIGSERNYKKDIVDIFKEI